MLSPEKSETSNGTSMILSEEDIKKAETLAKSIGIPPQPRIVLDIQREADKTEVDFAKIADLIAQDVSLSAKVLKIANSPIFNRGRTDSVLHALSLMGMKNFYVIVLQAALENALAPYTLSLDKFWKHSQAVAGISAHISRDMKKDNSGQAYITGLFHDCGMTLLMRKFPSYAKLTDSVMEGVSVEPFSERFESVLAYENNSYHTNHCLMGYVMTKSWMLPEVVVQVILHHHHTDLSVLKNTFERSACIVLQLAEFIAHSLDLTGYQLSTVVPEWASRYRKNLNEIGIAAEDIKDLADEMRTVLG